jgi:outer membrane protein OmpA-like peptidoglycan-associated protein
MLDTNGAAPGSITVGATCTDSRGLTSQASTQVMVETPPVKNPEIEVLESRLALHSIYFPTAMPPPGNPKAGLIASQQRTLVALAADFKKYLEIKPDAHLILGGHADHRGSDAYNHALTERRVNRVKAFLVEQGVPADHIDTKAFGKSDNMTTEQVSETINNNPDLTPEERQRALKRINIVRMASNRRVDVTLSTTGQSSVRQFPFNAGDAMTLIGGREGEAKKTAKPAPKKRTAKPAPKNP